MKLFWRVTLFLFIPWCLSCTKPTLLDNLSAKDSIEVLVTLNRYAIVAERVQVSKGRAERYQVLVGRSDYTKAIEILHSYGLPREVDQSIESFTEPKGFVPNTAELQSLRLDHALGLQIERALTTLPNVVDVSTIVRSNFKLRRSNEAAEPPSASILIRYTSDSDRLPFSLNTVRQIVSQAVPGLPAEEVRITVTKVSIAAAESSSGVATLGPFDFRVVDQDRYAARGQILLAMAFTLLLGFLAGILAYYLYLIRRDRSRREARRETTLIKNSFLLEGSIRNPQKAGRSRK